MSKINISPQAKNDLLEIKEYIINELDNPKASKDTIDQILKSIRQLTDLPLIGVKLLSKVEIESDYRFLISGNYLVFYRFDEEIYVVRILYAKRDYIRILFEEITKE